MGAEGGEGDPGAGAERSWPVYLVLALALIVAHGLVLRFLVPGVLHGSLIDPDSYTRLVRVGELHAGGGWYDGLIRDMNAPYGLELHWTRPLDVLLLLGSWPPSLVMGFEPALYWTGALLSPALHVLTCLVLAWAVAPLIPSGRRPLVVLVFLMQPVLFTYGYAGRADHHMLLVLTYVVSLGLCVRALSGHRGDRAGLLAGAAAGFGLWLSVEFVVPLVTLYLPLVVSWILGRPGASRTCLRFSAGLVAVTAVALLAERPPGALLTPEYDRVSAPYALLLVLSLALWWGIRVVEGRKRAPGNAGARALLVVGVGGALLGGALLAFPGFLGNPMGDADPAFEALLLAPTEELQPIFPRALSQVGTAVARLGHVVFALPFLVWTVASPRARERSLLWLPLGLGLVVFLPLGLYQIRYGVWVTVPVAVGAAAFLAAATGRLEGGGLKGALARAAVSAGVLLLPLVLGGALLYAWGDRTPPPARAGEGACSVPALSEALAGSTYGGEPRVVLAHPNIGPELVYRTRHAVVAAPYHRNVDGILDAHAMLSAVEEAAARELMARRGVDLVALCPPVDGWFVQGVDDAEATLFHRLVNGPRPAWLERASLPGGGTSGFLVFAVVDG